MTETKTCQNCKNGFTIEPEDFAFYEKIKVPSPTFCPECRMIRRMMFANERLLFRRKDDFSGKEIVSVFPPSVPFPVYAPSVWWSDAWDPMEYGREYDFSRPFFGQFKELSDRVPRYSVTTINSQGCEYCTKVVNSKDSYLTVGWGAENCLYGNYTRFSKGCVDYYFLDFCDFCYESLHCYRCTNVLFSQYAVECRDSAFLYDCKNCSNCFGCIGLRNKQYYIFNKAYTPEEYARTVKSFSLDSYQKLQEVRKRFADMKLRYPVQYARLVNSIGSTGNDLLNAKNCRECFDVDASDGSIEDSKYVFIGTSVKDGYDVFETGENGELCYEDVLAFGYNILFSVTVPGESHDIFYSETCFASGDLFGCVGLKNKQYCILNKQYSKEEYEALVPKIIQHMNDMPYCDMKGRIYRFGEFFPTEFSPFAYNESVAHEYFPLTKEMADAKGYQWNEPDDRKRDMSVSARELPDHISDVADSILQEKIGCSHAEKCNQHCTGVFKIIPQELQFYRRMNLPLPRLCPNCRHYERIAQRNPLRLWKRKCQCSGDRSENSAYKNQSEHVHKSVPCPNEFETSYAPDRPEIVYCGECYQAEVV